MYYIVEIKGYETVVFEDEARAYDEALTFLKLGFTVTVKSAKRA